MEKLGLRADGQLNLAGRIIDRIPRQFPHSVGIYLCRVPICIP
jgi:hypothetical protein